MSAVPRRLSKFLASAKAETWCPHTPTTKQATFLALANKEALYGGQVGGGKSDALLMGALQHVHVPGYSAGLFRRTYQDLALPGSLIDRSQEWLRPTKAHWDGVRKQWRFPSGAKLTFGYLDSPKDRYRYQSSEFQYLGFDELTQLPEESWYVYLLSRLRSRKSIDVPQIVRAATNPGGVGHGWVHRRFILQPEDRAFVPAGLADNPHLDADEYRRSLAQLDSVTRQQLLEGIWTPDPSGLVYRHTRSNVGSCPGRQTYYAIGLDFGIVDRNAITVIGWTEHSPIVWIVRSYYFAGSPSKLAEEIQRLQQEFDPVKIVGDVGGLGKGFQAELQQRFSIPVEPAQKTDKLGYIRLLNGALERGEIIADPQHAAELLHEWSELAVTADGKEASNSPNHCSDATLYVWRWCRAFLAEAAPVRPAPGSPEEGEEFARRVSLLRERQIERERNGEWWMA